jgi:hypothetical protein
VRRPPAWELDGAMSQLWGKDVRIRYQETTSEDIEDFMSAAVTVIYRVCKPVRLLELLVVMSCVYKWSINPITNPNPVYSHSYT